MLTYIKIEVFFILYNVFIYHFKYMRVPFSELNLYLIDRRII